jgi:hypothetical protein
MADLSVNDITSNGQLDSNFVYTGDGIFDKLIGAVNKNIEAQYKKNRINGADYATVYLGAMQSVLAQSVQYAMQEKQIEADIALKEKQLEVAEQERLAKAYEVTNILPEQVTKLQEEIDLLQSQDAEVLANTDRQDALSTAQVSKLEQDELLVKINQEAIRAKTEDETGKEINGLGVINPSTDENTTHAKQVRRLEEEIGKIAQDKEVSKANALLVKNNAKEVIGKLYQDYGLVVEEVEWNYYQADNTEYAGNPQVGEPSGYDESNGDYRVATKFQLDPTSTFVNPMTDDYRNVMPTTRLQAELMKSTVERDVGKNTADGYKADSYYKTYRSLQELLFALANAGVVDNPDNANGDLGGIYGRIVEGMEDAMNSQIDVWDEDVDDIVLNPTGN